ncbi:unnamed protein product [Lactuca virosa]|uniref:Uncharacterized protein n=1 Tax=Lactuca virosa TaxID=75947 RepID=A0AAU9PF01_9ASTR|nr:unnamed protein product [Lactuca virosa]
MSNEGGSVVAVVPPAGQEQPADGGQPPSAAVSTTSVLTQTSQIPTVSTGMMSSAVGDHSATPTLFQQSSTNRVTGAQPVVFQTPPPPNHMTTTQSVVFQTPLLSNQMTGTQPVVFQTSPPPNQTIGIQPTFLSPPIAQMAVETPVPFQMSLLDQADRNQTIAFPTPPISNKHPSCLCDPTLPADYA